MSHKILWLNNKTVFLVLLTLTLIIPTTITNAQINKNGSFENTEVGDITNTGVDGWLIQIASGIDTRFEVVDNIAQQGEKSLKATINGTGTNQWDIQIVADSLPVNNGKTYTYSIWAKAEKAGAQVNFTVGNYSYSEYGAIRPATLTTEWKQFTMQFNVSDNKAYIRAPIHLSIAGNVGNVIYIDNLQIYDNAFGKTPVIVQAESGVIGSNFSINQDGDITYVTAKTNYTGQSFPGDSSRIIIYQAAFQDSGYYNLFAHVRVGAGTFNDDSFFYGRGFGAKNDTAGTDWVFINGLAGAGFSNPTDVVNEQGTGGSEIWKWVNVTKYLYSGDSPAKAFFVDPDSLIKTFQIASREDGLYIDKLAFGKSYLYFTVNSLNNGLPGSMDIEDVDSSKWYQGPPLAEGAAKFLGSVPGNDLNVFANYWTQLTPGNEGKWASVAGSQDTTKWNWTGLDRYYKYAKDNNLIFKDHTLIWGQQQPSWINNLDSAKQLQYIETWIRMVGKRYPNIDMVDVVNEPLYGHNPPDGLDGRANYKNALGGKGTTGWDWVINAFTLARKYLPNTKLLINDYGIINDNGSTYFYLQIIKLLKERGLIDGIGVQGHRFELESAAVSTLNYNLNRLAATGLPIYISELDLGNIGDTGTPNNNGQLTLYKKYFPVLWEHPGVKGITLWGYIEGNMWQPTCYLINSDGSPRPAFDWLTQYVKEHLTEVEETVNALPAEFKLEQNYPNPFNPSTRINYSIPQSGNISLKVFNLLGQEVATLFEGFQTTGIHSVVFNGSELSSGIYFYQLKAKDFSEMKKLILLK